MVNLVRRLFKDKRGNALIIAAAAMPVMIGSAGLATDTIQWVVWKRQLQRAADSAAFAGVYAKALGDPASSAVSTDLVRNNHVGINLISGYPVISYPTSVNYTNGVQVGLAVRKTLGFSSLFMSASPIITTSATAAMIDQGDYCVVALEKGTATGISIGGNSSANLGCGAISNSRSAQAAVAANGTSYTFTADPVSAVGGLPSAITGVTTLQPHHIAMPDPFSGKYPTSIPPGMPCNNFNQQTYNVGTGQSAVKHLSPGCFTGFAPNGSSTYYLDAGVYYINNADFQLNGNDTLIGSNVTIILTGTTPGSVKINGTSTLQLSAPTSGTYANMLFIQSSSAASNNGNTINGTAGSSFDGAFYFPKGQVSFTGTSGSMTKCAMVVANQVVFSGNTNLQNNTSGCVAATKAKGKSIRLVA